MGCIYEDGLKGGGGVWADAHLRLTQNFAYTPYPATTQKKGSWYAGRFTLGLLLVSGVANTKIAVLEEVVLVFGRAKF